MRPTKAMRPCGRTKLLRGGFQKKAVSWVIAQVAGKKVLFLQGPDVLSNEAIWSEDLEDALDFARPPILSELRRRYVCRAIPKEVKLRVLRVSRTVTDLVCEVRPRRRLP